MQECERNLGSFQNLGVPFGGRHSKDDGKFRGTERRSPVSESPFLGWLLEPLSFQAQARARLCCMRLYCHGSTPTIARTRGAPACSCLDVGEGMNPEVAAFSSPIIWGFPNVLFGGPHN